MINFEMRRNPKYRKTVAIAQVFRVFVSVLCFVRVSTGRPSAKLPSRRPGGCPAAPLRQPQARRLASRSGAQPLGCRAVRFPSRSSQKFEYKLYFTNKIDCQFKFIVQNANLKPCLPHRFFFLQNASLKMHPSFDDRI